MTDVKKLRIFTHLRIWEINHSITILTLYIVQCTNVLQCTLVQGPFTVHYRQYYITAIPYFGMMEVMCDGRYGKFVWYFL